jgi:single-stranded-DNA-specific exonuclease
VPEVRFEIPACPPERVEQLRRELGVSRALAQVLVRRGLGSPEPARAFLRAGERHAAEDFAGIERAVARIDAHLRAGTRITVHGDYDVDGICSTAVLVRALRRLGANVDWYLPDRASDGYGLAAATAERLAKRGTKLLITVDCGITAVQEVQLLSQLGVESVITDHHAPRSDGALPAAPIVHPALCDYPCPELCATAVAYKLAHALWQERGRDTSELEQDLDLVALATIADVVPLTGENRTLVREGLRALASTLKPGLRALMAVARVEPGKLAERAVAFALAPRLNAAGRLYTADAGLELVLTEDRMRAAQIAEQLDRVNHERRRAEQAIAQEAEAQIAALGDRRQRRALVLAGEGWHAGVVGIVASRLAERHGRPVVLVALQGQRGRGSGRSGCEAFDLLAGLNACAEHLERYGGHRAAAGLEIERERVPALAAALDEHARGVLSEQDLAPRERVDAIVEGEELGMELAHELQGLAPFGQGNPTVSLMLAQASFADLRPMGEGKHLRFTVQSARGRARAVAFNTGARLPVAEGERALATFALEINEWNGVSEPRLVLRRVRPADPPSAHAPPPAEQISPAPERTADPAPQREPARRRRAARPAAQELALFS